MSGVRSFALKAAAFVFVACLCVVIGILMCGKSRADGLQAGGEACAAAQGEPLPSLQKPGEGPEQAASHGAVQYDAAAMEDAGPIAPRDTGDCDAAASADAEEGAAQEDSEGLSRIALHSVDGEIDAGCAADDPRVGIKVVFEYPSDGDLINPHIEITDAGGNPIAVEKRYDPVYKTYEVNFVYPVGDDNNTFTVLVTAPGYEDTSRAFSVYRNPRDPDDPVYYGYVEVGLNATPAYRLGRDAAAAADELLAFGDAEDVLCITTAGGVYYRGESSEDALEGILNYTYGLMNVGRGDLLTLRRTRDEPIVFAFVVKKGGDLRMAYFRDGNPQPAYVGTVSRLRMSESDWKELVGKLGEDAFPVASLANAWAEGVPADVLIAAAFHGHLCVGTIAGYAMVETMFRFYPPGAGGSGIESTQYLILGVPGGSDDDVFQWVLDATPGKRAYLGRESIEDRNMMGFIRWDSVAKKGTLVVMGYDLRDLVSRFRAETGMGVSEDTLLELHFNAWLVGKLVNDPTGLVRILLALDGLSEAQCNYLTGGVTSTTVESAHGLDMEYIEELKKQLGEAAPATYNPVVSPLTLDDITRLGEEAARTAITLFRDELGIAVEKDDPRLFALTNAGFARLFGLPTSPAWDGINAVLGSRLSRKTLLPVHSSLMSGLWFAFSLVVGEGVHSVFIRYDTAARALVVQRAANGKAVNDIGPATLNNSQKLSQVSAVFGRQFSSIQTISNAMRYDPPYEMVLSYLFHNHVCPGVSPSYLISDMIYREFPLGEGERYIYLTAIDYCKEDGLIFLLGLSAGGGSYYNLRLKEGDDTRSQLLSGGNLEGILIRWNEELQVGQAVVISFTWPRWDTTGLTTNEARREAQIGGFIQYYKGIVSARMTEAPRVAAEAVKWITKEELEAIRSWSPDDARGNVLQFVMGLPDRSLSDLIPANVPSEGGGGVPETAPAAQGGGSAEVPTGGIGRTPAVKAFAVRGPNPYSVTENVEEEARDIRVEENAEAEMTPSPQAGEELSSEEKARFYEVEEVEAKNSAALPFAVAGLVLLAGFAAFGFFLAHKRQT